MLTKKFQCLIFDLDDTLFDTSGQLIQPAIRESCEAMIKAGLDSGVDACIEMRQKIFEAQPGQDLFKALIRQFGTRSDVGIDQMDAIWAAGYKAFYERPVPDDIRAFAETKPILARLRPNYQLFLVTAGAPQTQKAKIQKLGLESYFKKIYYVDLSKGEKKLGAFRDLLLFTKTPAKQFLSIGNRLDSEIADSKSVGMSTCWVRRGEYAFVVAKRPEETPDFQITQIKELIETCRL